MTVAAFKRLGMDWAVALFPAMGAAIIFVLFTPFIVGPFSEIGYDLDLLFVSITHGLFITLVADGVQRRSYDLRAKAFWAGGLLGLIIWGFALLDHHGSSYSCADGVLFDRSAIPMLPWGWIGWFVLALFAVPSRLLGHGSNRLEWWPRRVLMLFPFAAIILFVGVPFQRHRIDCDGPDISYGLFDGGMIAIPILGLFLFSMAFSLAVLSAAYVRPLVEVEGE
jgi:hypothetical protein